MTNLNLLLTIPDFARATGLSDPTVRRMVARGEVLTVRAGSRKYIPEHWLRQWVSGNVSQPEPERA